MFDYTVCRLVTLQFSTLGYSCLRDHEQLFSLPFQFIMAIPWFKWIVVVLSTQRYRFNLRPICVGYEEDKLALGYVLSENFSFLTISFHQCSTFIFHSYPK